MKWRSIDLLLFSFGTSLVFAEPPGYKGKIVLFGNLHAHSALSDDVHKPMTEMSPELAFTFASQNGIDFLAISDHHKATDSPGRLFMTQSEYEDQLVDKATDITANSDFIGIPAIEWGNTASGNHLNVFGAQALPPDTILDADYDDLYERAKDNAKFIQFNHPYSWKNKSNRNTDIGNYGIELYNDTATFVEEVDPVVKTMSIITSVWKGHIGGPLRHATNSYIGLMNGFEANRVYATEDDEMVVVYQVEYKGKRHWMGDTVIIDDDPSSVDVVVKVWQATGSDGDSIDEGPYTITVYGDNDGIGNNESAVWRVVPGVPANELRRIHITVDDGDYVFIKVTEENGKDNPEGDGEDEFDNETGDLVADGKRDDMNDSAWTTPIWFVED